MLTGLAAIVFAYCAVVAGMAVHTRQVSLSHRSSYDTTWIASQASVEFSRLFERVSALAGDTDQVGIEEVRLRRDIFLARYGDFDGPRFRTFLSTDGAAANAAAKLSDDVTRVGRLVDDIGRPGDLDALRSALSPMIGELATVAGSAHRFGIDQTAADQGELYQLTRSFVALTACMTACCAALVALLLRQNRFLAQAKRELAHIAEHDPLTGLPNRAAFSRRLQAALAEAVAVGGSVAVHALDLDRFKAVNDGFGHAAGDELLRQVAERLIAQLPGDAFAARLGGDEFAVVQVLSRGRESAGLLASSIGRVLSRPYLVEGRYMTVGASVGVAIAPADGAAAEVLLRKADRGLYGVKRAGGPRRWAFGCDRDAGSGVPSPREAIKHTGAALDETKAGALSDV